jgi:hypothetical protein
MVPIFICGVWFVNWHRKREQEIVATALPDMVVQRAVAATEVAQLASLTGRRAWRAEIRKTFGQRGAGALAGYQAAVTELAFLRHARKAGTAGPDAAGQETLLVAVLAATRARAVALAGLRPIGLPQQEPSN